MSQGQVWSLDAIVAIGVVVVAIIGLIIFSSGLIGQRGTQQLVAENTALTQGTASPSQSNLSILQQQLDETRVQALSRMSYEDAKRELGLTTDFCIHFADQSGNIIPVGGVWFLGDPDLTVTVPGNGGVSYTFTCNGTLLLPACANLPANSALRFVSKSWDGSACQ
jgi:hypothetical protein